MNGKATQLEIERYAGGSGVDKQMRQQARKAKRRLTARKAA